MYLVWRTLRQYAQPALGHGADGEFAPDSVLAVPRKARHFLAVMVEFQNCLSISPDVVRSHAFAGGAIYDVADAAREVADHRDQAVAHSLKQAKRQALVI